METEPKFKPGDRVRFVDGSEDDETWTVTNSSSDPPVFKYSVMNGNGKLMPFIQEEWMVPVPKVDAPIVAETYGCPDDSWNTYLCAEDEAQVFWDAYLDGSKKGDETLADFRDLMGLYEGPFEQKMSGNARPMILRKRLDRFEQRHGVGFTKFLLGWLKHNRLVNFGVSIEDSWLTQAGIVVRDLAANLDQDA